jgi:lipopolysaccharide exporter
MISMRWAIRSAGLVSTVILARVLTPADFGLVAMASLVFGLLIASSEMGAVQLLLRTRDADRGAYDTAWTIRLIQTVVLALLMFLLAWPTSVYFKEPRLVEVMQVVAAGSLFAGLNNIGIVMFRRDLDFRRDFLFGFYSKVVTVTPTIMLALVWRNYWALVIGPIVGHLFEVLISYRMHPFRPRPSLIGWRRFVTFSLWITPAHIATFLNQKVDVFVVGYIANTSQMGVYNVASELSRMATAEIVTPMARALYPNYVKLKDNLDELSKAFLIVLRTVGIVSFAFGFFISAVAEDVVFIVLGDQWDEAVPLMQWLGVFGAFATLLATATGHILIALHRERLMFTVNWLRLAVLTASVLAAAPFGGMVAIAAAATVSTALVTVGWLLYLPRVLPLLRAGRILAELGRVFLIALLTFVAVRWLHATHIESRWLTLVIDTATGSAIFATLSAARWLAAGRPDGPEKRMLDLIRNKLRR